MYAIRSYYDIKTQHRLGQGRDGHAMQARRQGPQCLSQLRDGQIPSAPVVFTQPLADKQAAMGIDVVQGRRQAGIGRP